VTVDDHDDYWQWIVESGDLTMRTIERNDTYIHHLVRAERAFWHCVQSDEEPGPYLREGEAIIDDPEVVEAVRRYGIAKARMSVHEEDSGYQEAEAQKKEAKEVAKNRLAALDAKRARLPDGDSATFVERGDSGYWRLYPADRTDYVRAKEGQDDDTADVPF